MTAAARTFKLFVIPTGVHEPERFMVYFEQIAPELGSPFAVDPLLDFYSPDDAREVGKLQFLEDIHQVFAIGDTLLDDQGELLLVKGTPNVDPSRQRQKLNSTPI